MLAQELQRHTPGSALVVEGGAMRGIFAAGVLDAFLDHQYRPFDICLGVSAGSTNLAAWLAGQRGRNRTVITDYSCRSEFISFRRFLRGGHWFDLDWLWDITLREICLDTPTLIAQPIPLFVVTTAVETGEAAYVQATAANLNELLKASCSIPLAYRNFPVIDGMPMTDGGVADSIPVIKAYEMGARKITVVLSRPLGYQKSPMRHPWLINKLFRNTPKLAEAMLHRAERYNQAIAFINQPPADCELTVIAPPPEFSVGRTTTDPDKLQAGYRLGIVAATPLISGSPG
ncbi:patatin family protein [Photobacterium sp. TY1-4]|uniref:patatin-like phospholipase family protein n=1 Tax=Photobacterium sp. TY1-4 TaxID=2899122 RepID=UPI0021C19A5E|nr:patatin family protein [Photobacterium sp. TY1-4]UXI03981.1 patatin family protein [Photobacterium sp. TY1-4]